MPQTAVKLIWSMSACNFCPRSDVRTCQVKPGKLLSKLSTALQLEESSLGSCAGICTCCLADIDMIIRAVAIRGAMKDYFMDMRQSIQRGFNPTVEDNSYFNGHYQSKPVSKVEDGNSDNQANLSINVPEENEGAPAPPLPALIAKPSFMKNSPEELALSPDTVPLSLSVTPTKKTKERTTRYQCMLCDKVAGSKSHCMEHLICHSPVRPFKCSQCMKTYKSRKACREHLIVMHGVEKTEENLQRLVIVDHVGLKMLENVCTQYRKLINQGTPKSLTESASLMPSISKLKTEREANYDTGGGSAWLYKTEISPQLPPPLLQCGPSILSDTFTQHGNKSSSISSDSQPPLKRTRKGTPHKLVHEPVADEFSADMFQMDTDLDFDESNESFNFSSDKSKLVNSNSTLQSSFSQSMQDNINLNKSYIPSFQVYSNESPVSWINKQSPTGSKKPQPPCEVCGKCFPTKEKMADHMRSHSEVKQFSCLVCNKFFKYRRGVTNHLKEVHHFTDRIEINSKVSSNEEGFIGKKSLKPPERKAVATNVFKPFDGDMLHQSGTSISEKVIQDTLSSLADIRTAADSAPIMVGLSSNESSPGVASPTSIAQPNFFPRSNVPTPDNSMFSIDGEISSVDGNFCVDTKVDHIEISPSEMRKRQPAFLVENVKHNQGDCVDENFPIATTNIHQTNL